MTGSRLGVPATGVTELDRALGGLYWGDNVVWERAGASAEPFFRAVTRQAAQFDHVAWVTLADEPPVVAANYEGVEALDARPGTSLGQPRPLLAAIEERCRRFERNLVLFDPLETMAERWGAATAGRFFARCCPRLLGFGAIAYWSLAPRVVPAGLRREVEEITQCVLVLDDDRLRIAKAEGRPPGVEGSVFHCRFDGSLPSVSPAPLAARLGVALRALRLQRELKQADLARIAGVSPSAISQAERGQRGLSLETLLTLSRKLGVTLDELLGGQLSSGYRLARRHEPGSAADARPLPLLDDPGVGLRAYLMRLPPRASGPPPTTHKGLELLAVGRGLVQVVLATGRPVIRAGEVLLAESAAILSWRNLGPSEATLFWILRDEKSG